MASEGGGGTDLFTFLFGIVILGVLVQAGYSAVSSMIGQEEEPVPVVQQAIQTASTTIPNSSFDQEGLPPSERY